MPAAVCKVIDARIKSHARSTLSRGAGDYTGVGDQLGRPPPIPSPPSSVLRDPRRGPAPAPEGQHEGRPRRPPGGPRAQRLDRRSPVQRSPGRIRGPLTSPPDTLRLVISIRCIFRMGRRNSGTVGGPPRRPLPAAHYNFEVHKTIARIRHVDARRVAPAGPPDAPTPWCRENRKTEPFESTPR